MSQHVSTEEIKESLKRELNKTNSEQSKPSNQEKANLDDNQSTESEKQKPSDCISLVELCDKFIESRLDRGFCTKTINDYKDSNNLLLRHLVTFLLIL